METLIPPTASDRDAPTLDIYTIAGRAAAAAVESQVWVSPPSLEALVDALQKDDIPAVVILHFVPSGPLPSHDPLPEIEACIRKFLADPKELTQIVQFVTFKLKKLPGNLERIY